MRRLHALGRMSAAKRRAVAEFKRNVLWSAVPYEAYVRAYAIVFRLPTAFLYTALADAVRELRSTPVPFTRADALNAIREVSNAPITSK